MGQTKTIANDLNGRTRRGIKSNEILSTLRDLSAELKNRRLDLEGFVMRNVKRGLEANRRKHGSASTIYTWKYFVPGLFDELQTATQEARDLLLLDEHRGQELGNPGSARHAELVQPQRHPLIVGTIESLDELHDLLMKLGSRDHQKSCPVGESHQSKPLIRRAG